MLRHSPFDERAVGQADAVLPQDVGNGQRDAHESGNVGQALVELFKLLEERTGRRFRRRNRGS